MGWGLAPASLMIYGMNQEGPWSGLLSGIGAIGAGAEVARATLLLHGTTRNSTLEETLYAVAAAKFSAERCEGVGRNATIHVNWKRVTRDPSATHAGRFLTAFEVRALRRLWIRYGQVHVPDEAYPRVMAISQRITGGVSVDSAVRLTQLISSRNRNRS